MIWYDLVVFVCCLSRVNALFFNLFGRSLPVPRRHTPYFGQPDYRMYELNKRLQQRTEVRECCICLLDYPSWRIHDQTCFICIMPATESIYVAEYVDRRMCSELLDDQRLENWNAIRKLFMGLWFCLLWHSSSELESCLWHSCMDMAVCCSVIVEASCCGYEFSSSVFSYNTTKVYVDNFAKFYSITLSHNTF